MKLDYSALAASTYVVSIPERVLEALKHRLEDLFIVQSTVSIPERVLEALKPAINTVDPQSSLDDVSIPERVLEALKRLETVDTLKLKYVSIPERVLEALKRFCVWVLEAIVFRFNP